MSARALYQEAAAYCHIAKDYVTRDLFEKLMSDEKHHIDFLETQLDLVAKLGANSTPSITSARWAKATKTDRGLCVAVK